MWHVGAKLRHPFNPELGIGVVREIDGRYLRVEFPDAERELLLAAESPDLAPLVLPPGARARLIETGEEVRIASQELGGYTLSDGRAVADEALWPIGDSDQPLERLAQLRLDPLAEFQNRVDGLRLQALREAGGLGSFLGGRIELFPHQLHVARAAVDRDPVRWLLADEVGLGKTIEACLVLSALVRTGRAERALVIAPSTLVVQWLGELYRKFHQVFMMLDRERLDSVTEVYGPDTNPFEVHPLGVVSLELLASDRRLTRLAREAELEVVVVDEAHRLAHEPELGALGPLVQSAEHALLLTATPLQADRRGFFTLLSLLHRDAFPSFEAFEAAVDGGTARLPCTSAVRRSDLGGLPPRVPEVIELPELPGARDDVRADPRALWIQERVRGWLEAREKVLIFFHDTDELERVGRFLETSTRTHMSVFHERVSMAKRDIEVARFRDTQTPVLLCSEAGAEGRNFQFCDRMIHYDLPDDPTLLEQRIGRLDRIGRRKPVEILYFRCAGDSPDLATLYEELDLFARPSAGLDAALAGVQAAIDSARAEGRDVDAPALAEQIRQARGQSRRDLPRLFYPDAYDSSQADAILEQVPTDLEDRTRAFCLGAAAQLGLRVVDKGARALYFVELGSTVRVEGLPGVPDDARYLGSFDRGEAIRRDEVEFFASGHPLVEGLLLELEDGPRGRVAAFTTHAPEIEGGGLLCLYREAFGSRFVVVDTRGRPRPEWVRPLLAGLPDAEAMSEDDLPGGVDFGERLRELGATADEAAAPARLWAVALFVSAAA